MMKEAFASGETIALAKLKACEILGLSEDELEFEIVKPSTTDSLGHPGGKVAQVKAKVKISIPKTIKDCLNELLYYIGIEDFKIEISDETDEKIYNVNIYGKDTKYIVGRHGKILDSLQYMVRLLVSGISGRESTFKIRLDAGNYREQRRKSLESLAKRLSQEVIDNHKAIRLEPMRSYERKVIHNAIQDIDGVISWSEGFDEKRHVVISEDTESY